MGKELEALVCLKRARTDIERGNCEYNVTDYLDTIEVALLKAQKEHKALEIIKEKKINVEQFYLNFIKSGFGYHYYLEKWYKFQSTDNKKLTEEEFDLLKEVLE